MTEAPVSRSRTTDMAIVTDGLTKSYGNLIAVDHLNLQVERGEIFGFLGPNGAGKTTSMRMLLGLVKPTAGSAQILDMDAATDLPKILKRTGAIIENPTRSIPICPDTTIFGQSPASPGRPIAASRKCLAWWISLMRRNENSRPILLE